MPRVADILERHRIASTSGRGTYTVVRTVTGWQCSCPNWIYRRAECKHIQQAMRASTGANEAAGAGLEWRMVFADVDHVTPIRDTSGAVSTIRVPLDLGTGPAAAHYQATVVADLLALGVDWAALRVRYPVARTRTREAIETFIATHGRVVRTRGSDGHPTLTRIPADHEPCGTTHPALATAGA